jgi:circadian clock protein KaiC
LDPHVKSGLLRFEAWRPTQGGLEMHLLRIHKLVQEFSPAAIVVDPITNLMVGSYTEVYSMLMRLLDFLKTKQVTALFTTLTKDREHTEVTSVGVSSLIDTWILLRDLELNGERNRCIYVLKSRGMAHSNQLREFLLTRNGIKLIPAYVGAGSVLTGSARQAQEARERAEELARQQTIEQKRKNIERKRELIQAQVAALHSEFAQEEAGLAAFMQEEARRSAQLVQDRIEMSRSRGVHSPEGDGQGEGPL